MPNCNFNNVAINLLHIFRTLFLSTYLEGASEYYEQFSSRISAGTSLNKKTGDRV